MSPRTATEKFRAARDLLLELRDDHDRAHAEFRWPEFDEFNWALDWFDAVASGNDRTALHVVGGRTEEKVSYAELSERSDRLANGLRAAGVRRGDRLLMMLDNQLAVWEAQLAAMKLGAVVVPTFTTVSGADLVDRVERADVRHVLTTPELTEGFEWLPGHVTRICAGRVPGWLALDDLRSAPAGFTPDAPTRADETLFLYFTSGTTSRPKLVRHTHVSYPVGHLSGMYWNGVRPGDVHLNVSAPGWAKHAWSSFFVPLNAEASVLSVTTPNGKDLLDRMVRHGVTTFCAPPTVWRMLIQEDLRHWQVSLREAGSVGEPLNPEVVERVRAAWGVTVRDGYGQTETTAQIGNSPTLPVRLGSMGKPLPGYDIVLVDPATGAAGDDGEVCVSLTPRPLGVMPGYVDDDEKNAKTFAGGYYHTGDIAHRDEDGYLHYLGRTDDMFKSYDHRISPFELESVLLEHDAVAEAAVVPAPDPVGLVVPKAYVALAAGELPDAGTARRILSHASANLAPHQWVRRLEFTTLPKTTSGKIRRNKLRARDVERAAGTEFPGTTEYLADELLETALPAAPGIG
ncbi:AMP-binding protein [Lentzea sp. CC55]|uniref:AMP-binding protein n=1 Tax=Lentzea sp. CC55 TaxID=2884909 RepID=UPI001F1EE4E5|nr:AMP-binding protein [Lentzea sp. CC55]MCG8927643.1 AMP-binding protein [Lentzea sp. CC55]